MYRHLFLYYKGILAFIFEYVMVQEMLCNKQLENTRTDARYKKFYVTNNHKTQEQIQGARSFMYL